MHPPIDWLCGPLQAKAVDTLFTLSEDQKSRGLFLSVDWHERDPGFPRTESSCVLFAVSERSGGRWSFYGSIQKMDRIKVWPLMENFLKWRNTLGKNVVTVAKLLYRITARFLITTSHKAEIEKEHNAYLNGHFLSPQFESEVEGIWHVTRQGV